MPTECGRCGGSLRRERSRNRAEIVEISHGHVELTVISPPLAGSSPPFPLTLASAVPKGDRFDWLVEKATDWVSSD